MRKVKDSLMTCRRHGAAAAAAFLASALIPAAAHAQAGEPGPQDPGKDPTIIVQGERELEMPELDDAVKDMAMRGRDYQRPLPKYQAPLCPKVVGLGDRMGGYVSQRIRSNAVAAGLAAAEADCEANALVIVTDDPDRLIETMQANHPGLFDRGSNNQIKRAQSRGDAAIVWTRSMQQGPRGRNGGASSGAPSGTLIGTFSNAGGSPQERRLSFPSSFNIAFSIERVFTGIVFDVDRLDGAHLDQLSDFATLRILGSPQPAINMEQEGAVSILNLFDVGPAAAPLRMSKLDRAYLKGLYTMRPNEPSTRLEHFVKLAYQDLDDTSPCAPGVSCAAGERGVATAAPKP